LFCIEHDNLIFIAANRSVVVEVLDYHKRRSALLLAGYRLAVARVVAAGPIESDVARRLAVQVGLVKG
jgi:hypothetical protein